MLPPALLTDKSLLIRDIKGLFDSIWPAESAILRIYNKLNCYGSI
jgi:hypothetical protein